MSALKVMGEELKPHEVHTALDAGLLEIVYVRSEDNGYIYVTLRPPEVGGLAVGTEVDAMFADGVTYTRHVDRVFKDGSVRLHGGSDRWFFDGKDYRRIGKDGVLKRRGE